MRNWVSFVLACSLTYAADIPRRNFIDEHVFGKMERDKIPHALPATDTEFLRRVTLDLTGRLPSSDDVRKFIADQDPGKRDKLIDSLFPVLPTMGIGRRPTRVGGFSASGG